MCAGASAATKVAWGLAAFVWSKDLDEAIGTAHRIESGWVQVNQGGGQVVGQSYGGYKQSGIGRVLHRGRAGRLHAGQAG
ncbi:aldehyde dehydrogenase family protein [Ornithinimicrobium panacihumi]|uniref:aldehyde dehydrogenase family protein n=1 Tax=Ornithinimicrobium panacihumi TaxID=2008449 RepID=UPI003F8CB729